MQRKIAFYVDEHIGLAVVKALVRSNIDVITARDSGLLGAADARHLEHALLEKRVFVTGDADFARMHASGIKHCGIVLVPRHRSFGEIVRDLILLHEVLNADDMDGHIEYL